MLELQQADVVRTVSGQSAATGSGGAAAGGGAGRGAAGIAARRVAGVEAATAPSMTAVPSLPQKPPGQHTWLQLDICKLPIPQPPATRQQQQHLCNLGPGVLWSITSFSKEAAVLVRDMAAATLTHCTLLLCSMESVYQAAAAKQWHCCAMQTPAARTSLGAEVICTSSSALTAEVGGATS
jgi:hypothetical protein